MPWLLMLLGVLPVMWATPTIAASSGVDIVVSSDAAPYLQAAAAIHETLASKGHETRTVRLSELTVEELSGREGDAVVAVGTSAAALLGERLHPSVALVYCLVADPEHVGLEGRPRTHGVTTAARLERQFELIAEALPDARSLGMLYHADGASGRSALARVRRALPAEWRLEAIAVEEHPSVGRAIEALLDRSVDVVWTAPDRRIYSPGNIRLLLLAALRARVPVFGYSLPFVRAGALIGIVTDPGRHGVEAAILTDALLKAAGSTARAARSVPRTQVFVDLEPAVNAIVAETLSIDLPPSLLARATVIVR